MKTPNGVRIDSPSWPLVLTHVSYWGITTAAGVVGGTTIVDDGLATEPSYQGLAAKILDGPAAGQVRPAVLHVGNTLTVGPGYTNPAGAPQQIAAGTRFVVLSDAGAVVVGGAVPLVTDVLIYPVAEDLAATELTDTGAAPVFMPVVPHLTIANAEGAPGVAWVETVNFDPSGILDIISIYAEFEWQTRFLLNVGGTQSSSKIQISGDGGATWVDLTDNFDNGAAVLTVRVRAGVGVWVTPAAGANQLAFRLVHWTDDPAGNSASEAQIRCNSYVRITYRKV